MKRQKWLVTVLILALCLGLCGCGLSEPTLDGQMRQVVTALNEGEAESFVRLMYPDVDYGVDLYELYDQLRELWVPTQPEELKPVKIQVNKSALGTQYLGVYRLPRNELVNTLRIVYTETEEASGLTTVYLEDQMLQAQARSALYWICAALCWGFIIITLGDICRKKPLKYGWLILLAIFFYSFTLRINGSIFSLMVPVGSIVYWCIRKNLLQKKEQALAASGNPPKEENGAQ